MEVSGASINLLSECAVARLLGVSVNTVRRWRHLGRGPKHVKIGTAVRYKLEDVLAWLESRASGGGIDQAEPNCMEPYKIELV